MGVIGSIDFVKSDGIDGFQQVIGEVRFLYDFLCRERKPGANYILPDKITYDLKNVGIDKLYSRISQVNIGDGEKKPNGKIMKLEFFKYDGSALIISFMHGYFGIGFVTLTLDRIRSSFYALSALIILRCKSVISQFPQEFFYESITSTPEFYYMSKDLYGVKHVSAFLKQFVDWGLPFPDYILKTAVDTGDLEYAAALVHEKDALQMKTKEESLRL